MNRGNVLKELNRLSEAVTSYDTALALAPDYPEAHANRAVTQLLAGNLEAGWPEYEWRWKTAGDRPAPESRQPLWLGAESLAGKTILLRSEQGLGDTLQFVRYVPLVCGLGARVILQVQKPLLSLLSGLPGVAQTVAQGTAVPAHDLQTPLLSLPLAFKSTLATIPAQSPYVRADEATVARWRERLGNAARPRVGLTWSGSSIHKYDNRSLSFAELIRHLPPGPQYVSLQKDVRDADKSALREHPQVLDFAQELTDFAQTAALCRCLDLVISIDTSVAHLCGAMGVRTWILLAFNPDWRWLLERRDSPWYPSATLYRQGRINDWSGVLAAVSADLPTALG